ncbi:hypothetical protein SNE40_005941 [Patella caerulea]|uniref:PiggyBac transposable element-derived protein domain-containing protein n=1 Tax=Patella caerulea TaxID=87958 RepID=A0AAN8K0H2_PATCE
MLYDFDVYQGGTGKHTELGQGADVVLKLTSTLQFGATYNIYADNLFSGVPLLLKLKERGMLYVGTIRKNRLPNCNLEDEASLKKRGRGAYDYRVEDDHNIVAVVWYDNKAVTLLSSYVGIDPVGQARRWERKTKQHADVVMPAIIAEYNAFMGGIDKLDSFLAKYRFRMKSRRWYM